MSIRFLSLENVLRIHTRQIHRFGGQDGLRDEKLLESALAQPQMTFGGEFLHPSIYEMAGGYMFHLVMNHPFLDGNKRIGTAAALAFIEANGHTFSATPETLTDFAWKVAAGEIDKSEVIQFFKDWVVPVTDRQRKT
jgi:death-on-curing protein